MHSLVVIRTYLKIGLLDFVQYRADFFFGLIGTLIQLVAALLGLAVVFSQTSRLNGWSSDELVILIGTQYVLSALLDLVIVPSFQQLMEHVRLGTLDFVLTKPADAQAMISVQKIAAGGIAEFFVGLLVLGIGIARYGDAIGIGDALIFLVLLVCGAAIMYCFLLMLSTLTFWFVKLDNALVIFSNTFDWAGRWPIGIYPGWMKYTLTYVLPIAFVITVPAQALTGRLSTWSVILSLLLVVAFISLSRWFFRFGLKRYTGASA
jgi:ABC-2 type transport system permease protein